MRPPRSRTGVAVTRLPWTGGMSANARSALYTQLVQASPEWYASSRCLARVGRACGGERDERAGHGLRRATKSGCPLIGGVERGTFSRVRDLGMEHLSNEPEVVYLELMTRSVIDMHSESQTIWSTAVEGFGGPPGPSGATAGKCCSLRPASSVRGRRRGAPHRCRDWSRMFPSFAPWSRVHVRSSGERGRDGSPRSIFP
jgi:hypothetical protein